MAYHGKRVMQARSVRNGGQTRKIFLFMEDGSVKVLIKPKGRK